MAQYDLKILQENGTGGFDEIKLTSSVLPIDANLNLGTYDLIASKGIFSKADSSTLIDLYINPTIKSSGNLIQADVNSVTKLSVGYNGSIVSAGTIKSKEYFYLVDGGGTDEVSIRFTKPYYGRLNFAVPIANTKAEVRYSAKGSTSGNGNIYFVIASTEAADTGSNAVIGVAATRAFITNATNYTYAGTLHIGGQSWAYDGVMQVSGNVNASDTGKGLVQIDGALTFTSSLAANNAYRGIVETGTVGENVVFGDVLYLKFSDGKWWKAKADSYTTTPAVRMALATINANASGTLLVEGNVRYDSWAFAAAKIYLSAATAGALTSTQPSTTGNQIQVLGIAKTATTMYFKPSLDVGEI